MIRRWWWCGFCRKSVDETWAEHGRTCMVNVLYVLRYAPRTR